MADGASLTQFTEAERAAAQHRFAVVRPFLEEGVPLARLVREHGLALRTAWRWVRQYRQHGLAGLIPHPRTKPGQRRRLHPDLVRLVEGLALQTPPPTAATIHRQATAVATRHGWHVPSYRSVAAIIQRLDPALVTLAHHGTRAYQEAFELLHRFEASRPNELWQADHTPVDVWVLDERGQPAKPWLSVILDDFSRMVAGYLLGFAAPTALQTALTWRGAIGRKLEPHWPICGIPDAFYTDHGSDFTSRHLEQVAAELHVVLHFSRQGKPQGRGKIERFFQTAAQRCFSQLPGYAPPGTPRPTASLALTELEARFRSWLLDDYHHRVHSETAMTPAARWTAGSFLPRLPESPEQLDLLLLTVARPRTVHQDGIRFEGFRYFDLTLAGYVGEQVLIRYDPRDLAEIRVFHQDQFVCRAVCFELAGQTISLRDVVRARRERHRQLREQLADRAGLVDLLLAVHRPTPSPPPLEPEAPPRPRLKRYENE
jgi:putative transposase